MMDKIITTILLLLFSFTANAQNYFFGGVGYGMDRIHNNNLNQFIQTFNQYHEGQGFRPFNDFNANMFGLQYSAGYRRMKNKGLAAAIYYTYSGVQQENRTQLISKSGYELFYSTQNHNISLELGLSLKSWLTFSALGNLAYSNAHIDIWKVYANGNKSMGFENDLSGHYTVSATPVGVGAALGFKIWRLYIPIQFIYGLPDILDKGDRFKDFDAGSQVRSNELPKDYIQWVEQPAATQTDNFVGARDLNGMQIRAGITFLISK